MTGEAWKMKSTGTPLEAPRNTLLSFTNLTFVHIGACLGFMVDDNTAAPNHSLKMTLDAHSIPDSQGDAADHVPQQRLRRVNVHYSEISAPPLEVARFLSCLFTNLWQLKRGSMGPTVRLRSGQRIVAMARPD
ncbi:hypothetical protein B0H11DRAFT_1910088 [Mycena galericulata]|nr:hypothetical protein B0H11DRAFT_1910088 [Mycena galericulata]